MSRDIDTQFDFDRIAAEHVMGLLEGEEALTAEKLLEQDLEFAGRVEYWRRRFSAFDESAPRVAPSDGLWERIDAALPTTAPAIAPTRAPAKPGWRAGLWDSLGFWRGAGLAGSAAALVLAIGLNASLREQAKKPVMIAVLMTDSNRAAAVVNVSADGTAELVPLDDIVVPPGRALQIWTLWDRARGPVSVGLVNRATRMPLQLGSLPKTGVDQLFEISLEPEGGSTIGRPTGPVLMKGTASTAL